MLLSARRDFLRVFLCGRTFLQVTFGRRSGLRSFAVLGATLVAGMGVIAGTASAQTPVGTTAVLAVTVGGATVTTVSAGTVVTMTATVNAGGVAVSPGQVRFCDGAAAGCADTHLVGTAQLTSAGTATLKLRAGLGSHSYRAVFAGTGRYAGSASGASALTVTGTIGVLPSTTTPARSGVWGTYTLSATVAEAGNTVAPSGNVSFVDTSNGNSVLQTVAVGSGTPGVAWPNPVGLTTNTFSQAVAVGDFNGDGIPDVAAVAGGTSLPLLIFLGHADGSYTAAPTPNFSAYTFGPIVVADFNGDGKQDMAILNGDNDTVTVFLGNGDGTFAVAGLSPATGSQPSQLTVGDFNGDGLPDLAVTSVATSTVNVLLGNGDGTFAPVANGTGVGSSPASIKVADLNGDGRADLAVTDLYDDTVWVLLGKGDGTFAADGSVRIGVRGSPLAVGDFDGDGKPDLAVAASGGTGATGPVAVLAGHGDGTFAAPASSASGVIVTAVGTLGVGDFNGDGIADLAVEDSVTGAFRVLLNSGSASFTSFSVTTGTSSFPRPPLAVADLNGDGRSDLAIGNTSADSVGLYVTQATETVTSTVNLSIVGVGQHLVKASYGGDTHYGASASATTPLWGVQPATSTSLTVTSGGAPVSTVAPDSVVTLTATVRAGNSRVTTGSVNFCDASGTPCTDIHLLGTMSLSGGGTATFRFVPGTGTHSYQAEFVEDGYGLGSSSPASTLTVGPALSPVYTDTTAITSSNFPGNYSLTATVTGYGGPLGPTGNVSFLDTSFGNTALATAPLGASTAGRGWLVSQTPATGGKPFAEVAGDFNGDGIPDLAVAFSDSTLHASVTILFGRGDGSFTAGPTTQTQLSSNYLTNSMIGGDFNGDGKTDLVLLSPSNIFVSDSVMTLAGNGDGTFVPSASSTVFAPGSVGGDYIQGSLVTADFNGDGKMDLAVVGDYINSGGVTIALGRGDGTFQAVTPNFAVSQGFNVVATGDFNGDGVPDVVAANYFSPGGSTVLLGNGDGSLTAVPGTLPTDTFVRGIVVGDFNGDGRLDLAFGYASGVSVFLGNGDGTFQQTAGSPVTGPSESLVAGDFNHDGKVDLAGLDYYGQQVGLFLGNGDGTFTATTTTVAVRNGSAPTAMIVPADFNGDGSTDLALVAPGQIPAAVLLATPTATATATVNGIAPIGAGTHNVAATYGGDGHYPSSTSATVALTAGLAPLVVSPASGTYTTGQTVTITESVPGATIYYSAYGTISTDGFVPYTGPIQFTEGGSESIQAYATETGYQQANFVYLDLTLNLPAAPTPVFSLAPGSYGGAQTVMISDSVAGAAIFYTTNGLPPTLASAVYTGPLTVSSSETVVAIAIAPGYSLSAPSVAQYLIGGSLTPLIYTVAGNGTLGRTGDGGPATLAELAFPGQTAMDNAGNLYLADTYNHQVRKVAAGTGLITTVAGNGSFGYSGDHGPATSARLNHPSSVALDSAGNLYIADTTNSVIRMVSAASGVITTFAGTGTGGFSGDGGPATLATLGSPLSVALDSAGNVYIADSSNLRIRKVASGTGTISTVAGTGQYGNGGDNGPAVNAPLYYPGGVAVDSAGNVYIACSYGQVVRKVTTATGLITTLAGKTTAYGGQAGYAGDGGPATNALLNNPSGMAVDGAGNLYIADSNNGAIRKVTAGTGIITTVVGNGSSCAALSGDGGPATSAGLCSPTGINVDRAGDVYVSDSGSGRIREVPAAGPLPSTTTSAPTLSVSPGVYAGQQTVTLADATPGAAIYVTLDGTPVSTVSPGYNGAVTVTGSGTVNAVAVAPGYLPSTATSGTYTITAAPVAVISTVAGSGVSGYSSVVGPATSASFGYAQALTLDRSGNVYFTDTTNQVVWKLAASTGQLSVVAGNGTPGSSGDGGPATAAQLNGPDGLVVDGNGNLFIADANNDTIREVSASTGLISTLAGTTGRAFGATFLAIGDGGPATSAYLSSPGGLAFDTSGNLYIADQYHFLVRKITTATGIISTVAGNASTLTSGSTGNGGPAMNALLGGPSQVAIDSANNLFITESYYGDVRKVSGTTGIIQTVAGNAYGSSGDGGPAVFASLAPQAIAVDGAGNLYLSNNPAGVRKVNASDGVVTRIAGNGYAGYFGDGGSATMAEIHGPQGLAFDAVGNLYFADQGNYRIRKVTFLAPGAAALAWANPAPIVYGTPLSAAQLDATAPVAGSFVYSPAAGTVLGAGTQTLSVTFTPADTQDYLPSTASVRLSVLQAAPVLSGVASSLNPSFLGNSVTLTVSVTATAGAPTGSVAFFDGATALGTAPVSAGSASVTTVGLVVGTHAITAVYSGDLNFAGVTGAPLRQTVESYTIGVPTGGSSSATVSAGSPAIFVLAVTPPSVGAPLTFSVTGLPGGATATFSPATVAAGSGATNVTLTVNVPSTAGLRPVDGPWSRHELPLMVGLCVLPFAGRLRRRHGWLRHLTLALVGMIATAGVAGCGGGAGGGPTPAARVYTLVVTASSGPLTQSATLTLTVK